MTCNDLELLEIILVFKKTIDLIMLLTPLILVIVISIDLFKMVIGNDDVLNNGYKSIKRKFITACIIFLIPSITQFCISLINKNNMVLKCYNNANKETIQAIRLAQNIEKEIKEEQKLKDKQDIEEMEKINTPSVPIIKIDNYTYYNLAPFVDRTQRALVNGDCLNESDNCACPSYGKFEGFKFVMANNSRDMKKTIRNINDKMAYVKVTCSDGTNISKTVNSKAKKNFEDAFNRICMLKTTGIDGIKLESSSLQIDGTLVERTNSKRTVCSPHAYGTAIDINYNLKITVNNNTYTPYQNQGEQTRKEYDRFINALGRENDIRNVNYILFVYAFEPSGFVWGGLWPDSSFDPMHFEVKA
ncbi:MAG: M15 family metallopeptidase [Bacilli bacterium]|nr:M15 family metallopeptidase [Bacilli bacterium]